MTTAPTTTTITLAVPTPFAVDPARLVAWLAARGWTECAEPGYLSKRGEDPIWLPLDVGTADIREAVERAANAEGLRPCKLAALIAPPVEGPALQWAHMAAAAQASTVADIDGYAQSLRGSVERYRKEGDHAAALACEGRALGLEAAAAVLRGGAHG